MSSQDEDRFDVFTVIEAKDSGQTKDHWTKIGRMFPHKNGDGGFNIILNALPFTRKLVIKRSAPREEFEDD